MMLKKSGFYGDDGVSVEPNKAFFSFSSYFDIEDGVTLYDLLSRMIQLEPAEIELISALTGSFVTEYLSEVTTPESMTEEDKQWSLEVSRSAIIKRWDRETKYRPKTELDIAVNCLGRQRGSSEGWAMDMTSIEKMLNYRIVVNHETILEEWADEGEAGLGGEKIAGESHISFGEFLTALFREICFFESPGFRDENVAILVERLGQIEEAGFEGVPLEDFLAELALNNSLGSHKDGEE